LGAVSEVSQLVYPRLLPNVKPEYLGWVPPLVIGPPHLFATLRAFLMDSHYSEAALFKRLGIQQGQTTKDGNISLMTARCVGACSRAPVALCDGEVAGEASVEQVLEQLERWTVE